MMSMPLELWILAGLIGAAVAFGIARHVLGYARRAAAKETKNVYPLW